MYGSEALLENKLMNHLETLGYQKITIEDSNDLEKNFQKQLSNLNIDKLDRKELSDEEFKNSFYVYINQEN